MASILEIIVKSITKGSGFKDTEKDVTALSKASAGLNRLLGAAGLAVGAKEIFDYGVAAVAAAREAATANAELEAALKSSGQATSEYKAQLDSLATSIEDTSLFTDEQVQKAEATLVTFRNLGQDVMPRTIAVVADMGQKMGNLGSAAELAGKLLNNPAQAAARMQRQGILLTTQQKEQIAAFVEMGNTAGAQGILLDALSQKFGGQATAAREAAGGAKDWEVATGRLQESLGKLLLTIGDSGVGGAAVGLVETLDQGAQTWTTNVEQIQLFVEALNRANTAITGTDVAASTYGATVDMVKQIQTGWGVILQASANAAIESTVGWDQLAESYTEVAQEAAEATDALDATAQAANDMSSASNRAAVASYASMRGMMSQAEAARELESAFRQSAAAAASAQAASSFGGQQDTFTQNLNLTQIQQASDARIAAQKAAKEEEAAAAKEREQAAKESAQTMGQAIKDATKDLATDISTAVSDAVTGVDQDVIGDLMGLENAEANAGEAVRRMAAVAGGGIMNEWAPSLAQQLTGVQDKTAQAFVSAFQTGDDSKLKAAAQQLALNPIVELFDAQMIANQVEQKLRTEGLQQALNDKVNALLGEKGLPAVQSVTQQVGDAVTTTGDAAATVGTDMAGVATSAETAATAIKTNFTEAITAIDTLNARMIILKSTIEGIKKEAGFAAGAISGMNVPAAGSGAGSLTPNGAQNKMGGMSPQ